jgi:hypothetical protein
MDERDEAIQRGVSSAVALGKCQGERDALLAENRLLRDSLALVDDIDGWHLASNVRIALESAFLPRTAAEVERVRRLEAVLEAAKALIDSRGAHIEGCVPLKNAIAAYREGEQ